MAKKNKTKLNKLKIEKFRALENIEIEFGDHITVICGKNGTSKSSILGIAAQIFSFDKDYSNDKDLSFKQISDGSFKSQYSEHFRISNKFDTPGSMKVGIDLFDGYTNQAATARLELIKRGTSSRPVVRNNSTASTGANTSRNFTHPVIFLSLKRLYPIAARDYNISEFSYLNNNMQEFISLTNELLNRSSSMATGTNGTMASAVAHGLNYDQDSVSAGEDNAGQIILAIMSFRKLQEEYPEYRGGLLLIDEADAGLFPTAQINLLKMLDRECKELNLQVVMTSHSPVLIEYAYEQSQLYRKRFKTVYLSNTYGNVQVMHDWSWKQINADINTRIVELTNSVSLPRVNIYFEDKEAYDFFMLLLNRQPIKKFMSPLPDITLGCSNYIQLINKKITEFSEKSIICLDADQSAKVNDNFKTIVLLPGHLPPDQLIFEHLYNLPADDNFWKNDIQFSRDNFTNSAREVLRELTITSEKVDIAERLNDYSGAKTPREFFKRFYKDVEFQRIIKSGEKSYNPWKHWIEHNPEEVNKFLEKILETLQNVMKIGYSVDSSKLDVLQIRAKKV
ncbi:AAA family ATPase [Enterobacter kobei]